MEIFPCAIDYSPILPVADHTTTEGRAQNRQVLMKVLHSISSQYLIIIVNDLKVYWLEILSRCFMTQ